MTTMTERPLGHEIATRKWVYRLNKSQPDPTNQYYRVGVVVENEPGFFPANSPNGTPWYLDDEYCEEMNRKRGYDPATADEIVASSARA